MAVLFENEKRRIQNAFQDAESMQIEHFGSTTVPGLCAKPIVDILMGLDTMPPSQAFIKVGYEHMGEAGVFR
jgi:GrpB-like predicted nucleotidyltransferase (UPF0157 family)